MSTKNYSNCKSLYLKKEVFRKRKLLKNIRMHWFLGLRLLICHRFCLKLFVTKFFCVSVPVWLWQGFIDVDLSHVKEKGAK